MVFEWPSQWPNCILVTTMLWGFNQEWYHHLNEYLKIKYANIFKLKILEKLLWMETFNN